MPVETLQSWLPPPGPFSTFNHEERNAVATLYAALLEPANLQRFAEVVQWEGLGDPAKAEVFVEWTYARDLWSQHTNAGVRRAAILGLLQPSNVDYLQHCSVADFNQFFIAGNVAKEDIQYPGRWSLLNYAEKITDHEEFRRTCVFKWAFNVKPDLVVHGTEGKILCLEAKWTAAEGTYPSSSKEKAEFKRRSLTPASQTEVQTYLASRLLGFTAHFCYLVRSGKAKSKAHQTITWKDAFEVLDVRHMPRFIRTWVKHLGT